MLYYNRNIYKQIGFRDGVLEETCVSWNPWWADPAGITRLAGIPRQNVPALIAIFKLPHIKDIIGVRRSGKTTILYQLIQYLLGQQIPPGSITFLNFDDPHFIKAPFDDIQKTILKLHPATEYLFIDEIQQKEGWERWIRTLYDTKIVKQFIISGSSASLLTQDIGRVLTGRHISTNIYPFSFKEYLQFLNWKSWTPEFLSFNQNKILHYQLEYIREGGFPETLGLSKPEKQLIHTNIYNDILARDVASRHGSSFDIANMISYHLLSNVAKEYSSNSVAKATNLRIETAEKYLQYLQETLLLFSLPFFSYKTKTQFKQNKKIYAIDNGLRNAVAFTHSEDRGRLLENAVLLHLLRNSSQPYYWKDKSGKEVDFVVRTGNKITQLIQTCWQPKTSATIARETIAIREAARLFSMKKATIITEETEARERKENLVIDYIPFWKWALQETF